MFCQVRPGRAVRCMSLQSQGDQDGASILIKQAGDAFQGATRRAEALLVDAISRDQDGVSILIKQAGNAMPGGAGDGSAMYGNSMRLHGDRGSASALISFYQTGSKWEYKQNVRRRRSTNRGYV